MFRTRHVVMLELSGGEKVELLILGSRIDNRKTIVRIHTVMSELASLHRTIGLFLYNYACRFQHSFYTSPYLVITITFQVLESAPSNGRTPRGVKFVCKFPVKF
jgi:hypothetical protein